MYKATSITLLEAPSPKCISRSVGREGQSRTARKPISVEMRPSIAHGRRTQTSPAAITARQLGNMQTDPITTKEPHAWTSIASRPLHPDGGGKAGTDMCTPTTGQASSLLDRVDHRHRLLGLGCGLVFRIACLVGIDDAAARRVERHRGTGDRARRAARRIDAENYRVT
jgi:hypothetical protein